MTKKRSRQATKWKIDVVKKLSELDFDDLNSVEQFFASVLDEQ